MKFRLAFFITLGFLRQAVAQSSDLGNWMIYVANAKLSAHWSLISDFQYRNYSLTGDLEQLVARSIIQYKISEKVAAGQGYAFVYSEPYKGEVKYSTTENRPFQQLVYRDHLGRTVMQQRYRIEERFLEDDFRVRFRYMAWFNIPLNKRTMEKSTIFFSAYDEIFLHFDEPVFDKNRVYAGVGYVFNSKFRFEFGDMAQMKESGTRHQLQLLLLHNMDWSQKN